MRKIGKKLFGNFVHPVHVLEKDDQGLVFAQGDEEIFHRLEGSELPSLRIQCFEQRIVHPERQQTSVKRDHRHEGLGDPSLNLTPGFFLRHSLFDLKDRLYQVDHGKKVDIPAVLETDAGEEGRLLIEGRLKLIHEAAFPDTRLPDHINHLPLPLFRPFEDRPQGLHLGAATDEFSDPSNETGLETGTHVGAFGHHAIETLLPGLPLQGEFTRHLVVKIVLNDVAGLLTRPHFTRFCRLLNPGSQVGGVSHGGVVHTQIVPDRADNHGSGVESYADFELYAALPLYLVSIRLYRLLNGQGRIARPLCMIFVGDRCTEQGHDAVAGKLIDGSLVSVDFIHQDLETSVHDLVDFFGVELFSHGGVIGHVGEKHGNQLPLPFESASGGENLVSQEFGRVGLGLRIIDSDGFSGFHQFAAAFIAKFGFGSVRRPAIGTHEFELVTTLTAKLRVSSILKPAFWALHHLRPFRSEKRSL